MSKSRTPALAAFFGRNYICEPHSTSLPGFRVLPKPTANSHSTNPARGIAVTTARGKLRAITYITSGQRLRRTKLHRYYIIYLTLPLRTTTLSYKRSAKPVGGVQATPRPATHHQLAADYVFSPQSSARQRRERGSTLLCERPSPGAAWCYHDPRIVPTKRRQ